MQVYISIVLGIIAWWFIIWMQNSFENWFYIQYQFSVGEMEKMYGQFSNGDHWEEHECHSNDDYYEFNIFFGSKVWVQNIRRQDILDNRAKYTVRYMQANLRLCSKHFEPSQFCKDNARCLTKSAVPTLFDIPNQ